MQEDEYPQDVIRTAAEVAARALALFAPVRVALGASRENALEWVAQNPQTVALTEWEGQYLANPEPDRQQSINFSWQSERLLVLLWALGRMELPPPDEQCDTGVFRTILPPYAKIEPASFIADARIRPDKELSAQAGAFLDLHWKARDGHLNNRRSDDIDIGIVQERHHAINWVIGYCGLPWDEVTTDT